MESWARRGMGEMMRFIDVLMREMIMKQCTTAYDRMCSGEFCDLNIGHIFGAHFLRAYNLMARS